MEQAEALPRVLVLEDELKSISGNLRRARQEVKFDVVSCPDVADAIAKVKEENFALMIVDLYVPLSAGQEPSTDGGQVFLTQVFERLDPIERSRCAPFIVVTLHTGGKEFSALTNLPGCEGIFNKLEFFEIRDAIKKVLTRDDH